MQFAAKRYFDYWKNCSMLNRFGEFVDYPKESVDHNCKYYHDIFYPTFYKHNPSHKILQYFQVPNKYSINSLFSKLFFFFLAYSLLLSTFEANDLISRNARTAFQS